MYFFSRTRKLAAFFVAACNRNVSSREDARAAPVTIDGMEDERMYLQPDPLLAGFAFRSKLIRSRNVPADGGKFPTRLSPQIGKSCFAPGLRDGTVFRSINSLGRRGAARRRLRHQAKFTAKRMMLLDFRYGFVGKNGLVPHAPPPLRHDCLPGEGRIRFLVMRQVKTAHGKTQRFIEDQLFISDRPRKAHRKSLRNFHQNPKRAQDDSVPSRALGDGLRNLRRVGRRTPRHRR
jgi:hypothetical protein